MSDTTIRMYGADWCGDCRRSKAQLEELGIEYRYIDVEADENAAAEAERISGRTRIPVIVYPDGSHQVEPRNSEVEAKLRELALL